jgi:aminomethyltransferase
MTEFAGFEMPLQYSGILAEHRAVRSAAGLFDLSHMGEFELRGRAALELLERALTNSAARLSIGRAQYTIMCDSDGGTIDDLICYRRDHDRYMLCVNAANTAADWDHLASLAGADAECRDQSAEIALIAIQGPRSEAILRRISSFDPVALGRFSARDCEVAGLPCLVARTGYTGEDGFELFTAANHADRLFQALVEAGDSDGLLPCGLGARDTLRLEAGLPLYGHELGRDSSPLDAGLGAFVKFGRGFVGEPALADQQSRGPRKRLIGLSTDDGRSIARQGYPLFAEDARVGSVTSGTFAPSFDRPLAMGYLESSAGIDLSGPDLRLEVEIRSRRVAVTRQPLPFYRRAQA